MLQDKRTDLDAEKRKVVVLRLLAELSRDHPDLYYQATSDVARQICAHVAAARTLNAEERALLSPLSQRDIEVLLSLH